MKVWCDSILISIWKSYLEFLFKIRKDFRVRVLFLIVDWNLGLSWCQGVAALPSAAGDVAIFMSPLFLDMKNRQDDPNWTISWSKS
jgi:hypothetical protein